MANFKADTEKLFKIDAESPYHPVDLEFITVDSICDHDLYLKIDGAFVLYRAARLPFTTQDKERLAASKNKIIYIYCESEKDVRRFYEANLSNIIESPKITTEKKADVLYKCATGITSEIFEHPEDQATIGRTKEVVNNTIRLLAKGSDAFLQMLSISSHDYYTYTHCVNVMTFSIGVLSALGVKDAKALKEVGVGALLHDVGKARVPLQILNKPGPLSEEEWKVMKQHPSFGYEMVNKSPVPETGKNIIVQHHEKINGAGYPYGLKGDEIPLLSQVVSLCDAYDAMTTNRVYQKALKPFQAFKIITNEMKGQFQPHIVETMIRILNLKSRS